METMPVPFYDIDGVEIPYERWKVLRDDPDYRLVARTSVGDVDVVTAWLGRDQGDSAVTGDRPWIFGTIITAVDGGYDGDSEVFAATVGDARANHGAAVARLRG